ncbi:MAG: LysM peptidoglycan-binding domain-containing protein, partial [Actinomycetia bacterium]|nr:LysM peptidoglycan-binding domain-containing protein [Actinomycetes bacterium]
MLAVMIGLGSAGASFAQSSTSPPKNLKQVGDHWTPWDPPAPGPNDYIIVPGDTLWDLSNAWFGDPFLWPQIWDENRYILDSHWIYPGDPLVVPGRPTVVPTDSQPPVNAYTTPPVEKKPLAPVRPTLMPAADPADLYCSGYIQHTYGDPELAIAGHDLERVTLGQGDVIFLDHGRDSGMRAGDEFSIVRRSHSVFHPETRQDLGTFVRRLGKVRVMMVHETRSTAVIEMSCEDVYEGDELVSWQDIPVPMLTGMPTFDQYDPTPSGGPAGLILAARDNLSAFGEGNVIFIDLGQDAGLSPGDALTLYRDRPNELPRVQLGQAVVLTVGEDTASAKIVYSVRESGIG